jgi:hypothetical protein
LDISVELREMDEEKKKQEFRIGLTILILLGTFTIGEFFVGSVAPTWAAVLLVIASLKAYYVVRDYMHIGRVFEPEEEVS